MPTNRQNAEALWEIAQRNPDKESAVDEYESWLLAYR